eukprot:GDKH01003720.1.p1 GENE.GDKH01003720.1~~GDKH01003720.1.p1  ORF type:complete len:89 (-),score=3.88 GDKH01003720.1:227-493(-)
MAVSAEKGRTLLDASMDRTIRVTLTDLRQVIGTLSCIDNAGNMCLERACERVLIPIKGQSDEVRMRHCGRSISIPPQFITKLELMQWE